MLRRLSGLPDLCLRNLPEDVRRALEIFLDNIVRELGYAEVYLFGSYARGDWVEDSDIDIIVVSPRFRGVPIHVRGAMLRRLAPDTHPFEILAYTPEEFEYARGSVVLSDAAEYWIKLL